MQQYMAFRRQLPLYLMVIPGIIVTAIFCYGPMVGLVMAFQDYMLVLGMFKSPWIGFENFKFIMEIPDIPQVIWNTSFIATMKIVFGTVMAILMALSLNEVRRKWFKRTVQSLIYMPYFLSWIILGGILRDILSLNGIFNKALGYIGIEPVLLLGDSTLFPYLLVATDIWQTIGFGTIVYLAAITNISPTLYEAAVVDGAGYIRQALHITLPGMKPIIVLMITLSLGNVLNAGFDQVFVLYSPMVYETGDIIDTWVYRAGLENAQYSIATAVGLFKSLVSLILVSASYFFAYKYADYRIF